MIHPYNPAPIQDKEYKYRAHQLPNGKWQIERADAGNNKWGQPSQIPTLYWEYFMQVDSKEEADKIVAQAQNKPKYHYY